MVQSNNWYYYEVLILWSNNNNNTNEIFLKPLAIELIVIGNSKAFLNIFFFFFNFSDVCNWGISPMTVTLGCSDPDKRGSNLSKQSPRHYSFTQTKEKFLWSYLNLDVQSKFLAITFVYVTLMWSCCELIHHVSEIGRQPFNHKC